MDCHVHAAKELDTIEHPLKLEKTIDKIRKSLQKRQEAMDKFKALQNNFLASKARITSEINEARTIWAKAMERLPNLPF